MKLNLRCLIFGHNRVYTRYAHRCARCGKNLFAYVVPWDDRLKAVVDEIRADPRVDTVTITGFRNGFARLDVKPDIPLTPLNASHCAPRKVGPATSAE